MIIAVTHHFDFAESGDNDAIVYLPEFDDFFDRLRAQSDLTISPLAEVAALVTAGKRRRGLRYCQLRQGLHWRLQPYVPQHIVMTGPLWRLADPWGRETDSFGTVV